MSETAEVHTDLTVDDDYDQFVAEQQGQRQQSATEEQSEATAEEAKTETDSEPVVEKAQEVEDDTKWTPKQQKRLDQLTREKYEARGLNKAQESEIQRLRAELAEARKGKPEAAAESTQTQETDAFRKHNIDPAKFPTYEAALAALADKIADTKIDQKLAERDQKAKEAEQRSQQERAVEDFKGRVQEIEKTKPDFREKGEYVLTKVGERAAIDLALSQNLDLTYHLGAHPAELDRVLGMDDLSAVMELGRIAASISSSSKAPALPKKTSSPPPPGRVDGAAARTSAEDSDDYDEFARGEDLKRKRR